MAHNFQTWLEAPVIELQSIDSTNNYAMQLIDADKAQSGMTIIAQEQTAGKGQRGHQWSSVSGDSLLMSMIFTPEQPIEKQFLFSASVAVAVCRCLQTMDVNCQIKWPNDLIINDRKAGGILIENIIRGSQWTFTVIGIGINVLQKNFPETLPNATSLKRETNCDLNLRHIAAMLRLSVMKTLEFPIEMQFEFYKKLLYKFRQKQKFLLNGNPFFATINGVLDNGQLILERKNGIVEYYNHGSIEWVY